jgi:hypothetical protein
MKRSAVRILSPIPLLLMLGCDSSAPSTAAAPPTPPLPALPTVPAPAAPVAPVVPTPALPETETVKAEVGVGQRGRSLDEYEGVVVTPVKSLFAAKERLTFEVAVPQALLLFNATEGRFPKSHEEFMQKIIVANNIQLPELPPNHRYKWDPEHNELMVERPKLKSEAQP